MEDKIAIFYDIENLIRGYGGLSDKNTRDNLSLEKIIASIKEKTNVKNIFIQKAYADWTAIKFIEGKKYDMSFIKEQILNLGIEPVQVYILGKQEKDVSDIKLVVDAMDTLYTRDFINTFVIVSGDGGYISLIKRLKESGKKTIMASYDKIKSPFLIANCDDYILLYDPHLNEDELIQYLSTLTTIYGENNNPLEFTNKEILEIFEQIKNKFNSFPKKELLSIKHYQKLIDILNKVFYPSINYNRFGFQNMEEFIQNLINETNLVLVDNNDKEPFICNKKYIKSNKILPFLNKPDDIYKYLIKNRFNFDFDMDQLKEMFRTINSLVINNNKIDFIIKSILNKDQTLTEKKIESFITLASKVSLLSVSGNKYNKNESISNFSDFLLEIERFFRNELEGILNSKDIKDDLDILKILTSID